MRTNSILRIAAAIIFLACNTVVCSPNLWRCSATTIREVSLPKFNVYIYGCLNISDQDIRSVYKKAKQWGVRLPRTIKVTAPPTPSGSAAIIKIVNHQFDIVEITIHEDIAQKHDTALAVLTKELVGTAIALSWLHSNPLYMSTYDIEWITFVDGAAHQAIAPLYNEVFHTRISYWDGKTAPTCAQLKEIQNLADTNSIINHGVKNLLSQNNCDPI